MPSWENTPSTERPCACCEKPFLAKQASAKYCSEPCRNRARGPRDYDPVKAKRWREARLSVPGYRAQVNARANERATALRRWLDEYKVRVGCVDCGYNTSPIPLDFDHIGELKNRNVSASKSVAQAEAEIALCEVRCSNCHRIKTAERRHSAAS
jgi:hypothetical protein